MQKPRHDADAQVTALDWPTVLGVAEQYAAQLGVADRLEKLPGNFHEATLPGGAFDLILLANVAHLEPPERLRALLAKLAVSLKPGGELAVIDVMPGQPEGDLNRTLYELGLALRTERGRLYSVGGLQALLAGCGLPGATHLPLPVAPHTMGALLVKRPA